MKENVKAVKDKAIKNKAIKNEGSGNNNTEKQFKGKGVVNSKVKIKKPNMYNVVMLNDDFTPMDFVVEMLRTYFDKSEAEAVDLMLRVHNGKKAVVATYPYDVAVTKTYKVTQEARAKGYPFKVVVDKA